VVCWRLGFDKVHVNTTPILGWACSREPGWLERGSADVSHVVKGPRDFSDLVPPPTLTHAGNLPRMSFGDMRCTAPHPILCCSSSFGGYCSICIHEAQDTGHILRSLHHFVASPEISNPLQHVTTWCSELVRGRVPECEVCASAEPPLLPSRSGPD